MFMGLIEMCFRDFFTYRNHYSYRYMKPPILLFSACMTLALFSVGNIANAQWSTNASVNNPVSTGTGTQQFAKIVSDNNNGSIIVWADSRGGTFDIYAQRINATGVAVWNSPATICTAAGDQFNPVMIADGNGGAIIAWEDNISGTGSDIYAQRVNSSGTVQWTTNGVPIGATTNVQRNPAMALISIGDAVIVWEDKRDNATKGADIYAQRVNPSGVVQWTANGVVVSNALTDQALPAIVNAFGGGIFVAWQDQVNGPTTGQDIYMQRFNENGLALMTANGVPICSAADHQYNPKMIYGGNSDVFISWEDFRNGTDLNIYAQRMNSTGVLWTANGVAITTATGEQSSSTLVAAPLSQGAVIAWKDKRSGTNFDIYSQLVNSSGVVQWTANGVGMATTTDNQVDPVIVSDGLDESYIVAWSDRHGGGGFEYDIYAQKISKTGVNMWAANGVPVSVATADQSSPVMVYDNSAVNKTGYLIAWADSRAGNADVYAQRLNVNGILCGNPANPGAIAGFTNILSGTHQTYSIPLAVGADSYTWSLPSGWTGTSTTNLIELISGENSGSIFVYANNVCGSAVTNSSLPITVTKQNQTITFNALTSKAMGEASFDPGATASSTLPVSYISTNTAVAIVDANMITLVGVGTSTIIAKQAGNIYYYAATDVPQVLTVTKGNQVINLSIGGPKTLGDAPLDLAATASSGLPITYTSTKPAVATVNNNVLTFISAGSVTINADQPGNVNFNAAAQASQTFCVNPAKPIVTAAGLNTESPIITSSSGSGNQWFLNDDAIPSATNATLTVAGPGIYKVQTTADDCHSAFSDNFTFVITGDDSSHQTKVSLYPNPASDRLIVTLPATTERKIISIYEVRGSQKDRKETDGHEVQFDIAAYAQGIYLVKVSTSEVTQLIRFVKN